MRRIKGKNPDEGIIPLLIVLGIVLVGGYFGTQMIQQWNAPAVESAKSTAPLNAGLGYLFYEIGSNWMLTLLLILGTVLLVIHMRNKRRK